MSDNIVKISSSQQKDIQAYIDYCRIVGVDDGGKMFSEKEFEEYKKKVSNARKNHLYVYWTNGKGVDCKAIGPESMCFCGHRFKMHNFDNVKTKKVDCKDKKCKCPLYEYVPVHGSNDVKCLCKHSYSLHDNIKRNCTKPGCNCSNFGSKFTCNCGKPFDDHYTSIENKEERLARGKNVDPSWMRGNLTAGIGGLNSFTSMVGDVYEMEYKKLMNRPEDLELLSGEFNDKMKLGSVKELGEDINNDNDSNNKLTNYNPKTTNNDLEGGLLLNLYNNQNKFASFNNYKETSNAKMINSSKFNNEKLKAIGCNNNSKLNNDKGSLSNKSNKNVYNVNSINNKSLNTNKFK